ncbi:hypothetical protein H2515_09125 [Acidithiobacillus ferrivorans]|uniref:Uncharacterized protein n=1 Tax=Acidithiobacillus ferrivorans TaxID=160808 RepID=A0A7T4WBQ9_9PROT|nr:hypothetical protein H2515_09125 [Acidithiobacillus ferrivorans]
MQRTMLNGEPIRQGLCPNADEVVPQHLIPLRFSQNHMMVTVSYIDGSVLTFLFDRSTTIVDLIIIVSRAGTVQKVVL